MGYQVITQPQAEADIRQAVRWIAQYSPEQATLWYFDIMKASESLNASPARCPFAPERKTFGLEIRASFIERQK